MVIRLTNGVGRFAAHWQMHVHKISCHQGCCTGELPYLRVYCLLITAVRKYTMSRDLAGQIYQRAHLVGDFLLRSGRRSTEYFDKYLFECDPSLLRRIADEMVALLPANTEVIAGLELGGIPLVTALGLATGLPMAFVRKQAKDYGTCKLAEGAPIEGRHVVVVEDVVTSGGQVATSIGELRQRGAIIEVALCVIDRQQGGQDLLDEHGITLRPLFTMEQLVAAAQ
ncbi:MAG: hypothetical protein KatS3mg039_1366 [Candidatus Kapaibacterium sp.]|nr:MAG: hypothetical protein KatS3mg039_1366 [Candidatus Kapabacteria bacterium]